jgi:hypothetical protein
MAEVFARAEIRGRDCFAQTRLMLYGKMMATETESQFIGEGPEYPEFGVRSNGALYWPQTGEEFAFKFDGNSSNGELEVRSGRGNLLDTVQVSGDEYKYIPPHDPELNMLGTTASKPLIFALRLDGGGTASFTQLVHRSRDGQWDKGAGLTIFAVSFLAVGAGVVLVRRKGRRCC